MARSRLKDFIKLSAGYAAVGLDRAFPRRLDEPSGILLYHRVAPRVRGCPPPTHNVSPERFREQIEGLLECGYGFMPLGEVLRRRSSGESLPPGTVVVTFDDGFSTVHSRAWPVLRELEVPATVFLATSYLDSDRPFPFDRWGSAFYRRLPAESYRPLTTEECREMMSDGLIELGSHTNTHGDFRRQPEFLVRDTVASLEILRERFGLEEASFAFPGGRRHLGQCGDELISAVRNTASTCALTTECAAIRWESSPFGWGRFNVYQWDTAATLTAKLRGWYGWAPKLQGWTSRPPGSAVTSG